MLPPSSSLPAWPRLRNLEEKDIFSLLRGLSDIYCPLAFQFDADASKLFHITSSEPVDSGYASGVEEDEVCEDDAIVEIDGLRNDPFERNFSERWLTSFLARAESLTCLEADDTYERAVDQASCILEALHTRAAQRDETSEDDLTYTRDFSFPLALPSICSSEPKEIQVQLNDGLAGTDSQDPHDVGLQSWGASIAISALLCETPARFGLTKNPSGRSKYSRIVELGAGTGLVGIVLAQLLPLLGMDDSTVISTDYHEAVLANLRSNISRNFLNPDDSQLKILSLDWSKPPSHMQADMLIGTDVVYGPEHAVLLRDCAARLLSPEGVFWLVATVRQNGGFKDLIESVEAAFEADNTPQDDTGKRLCILSVENLDKPRGVGRGDESGYRIYRIGWA
ncbi:hypothetical protein HJFPF1_12207 [Paramyrothecium foliicola]|nr:hypothetical protein HJFPF1_12207 [Paramyrothecium foliicola]